MQVLQCRLPYICGGKHLGLWEVEEPWLKGCIVLDVRKHITQLARWNAKDPAISVLSAV